MWPFGKDARLHRDFAEAATTAIRRSFPEASVLAHSTSFELQGLTIDCDLESWFSQWKKSGHNGHIVLVELEASLRKSTSKPSVVGAPSELDPPEPATIVCYNDVDRVGRLALSSGEEVRFGATACKDFDPVVGAQVFVTAISPHPMGGRRAVTVRAIPTTEAAVRAKAEAAEAERTAEAERERSVRREKAQGTTTHEAIVARIRDAVMPDEDDDADEAFLYELIDDLELMGPSLSHVAAILEGITKSPPMAHFGNPGPLVHYAERFSGKGYEEALFDAARDRPRSHFLWMLARLSGLEDARGKKAVEIIRSWSTHSQTPEDLRGQIEEFL